MSKPRLLPAVLAALLLPSALGAEVVNRVVLRVNDQIATLYDFQQRRESLAREVARSDMQPAERREILAQIGEMAYKDLFEELLIESRADQLGVTAEEGQIEQQIASMKQNFGIQTDEEFQQALAQSGMTERQLRDRLQRDLRAREVMGREVQSRIKLDEEDLRRYYQKNRDQFRQPEQVQIREVVVLEENGLPTAEERQRVAGQIRQAVAGGQSLADAVAEHSQRGHVSNVIDLGWVAPGDLDPGLEAAAWKLAPGTLSEPVAGRGGLHLMQVIERREARILPFAEVQEQIRRREQQRLMQEEVAEYMAELEKKSLIVTEPPPGAENFRRLMGTRPPTEEERLGLIDRAPAAPPEITITEPGVTPMQDAAAGEPGALPEPKPTTNAIPPVVEEPPPSDPPPVR